MPLPWKLCLSPRPTRRPQVDIESTLAAVCDGVCAEVGQPPAVLKARAAALKSMGVIFQVLRWNDPH